MPGKKKKDVLAQNHRSDILAKLQTWTEFFIFTINYLCLGNKLFY